MPRSKTKLYIDIISTRKYDGSSIGQNRRSMNFDSDPWIFWNNSEVHVSLNIFT